VTADVEETHQGGVMQALGERKGELVNMEPDGNGRVRLEYRIPARGLIGFSERVHEPDARFGPDQQHLRRLRAAQGRHRRPQERRADLDGRRRDLHLRAGKLDDRGRMFVKPNDPVYEGMIVGIHSRDNDLVVNATRTKQLTNFRVSGKEDAIKPHAADRPDAGIRRRVHRRRRTGRDHAEERAPAQALPEGKRARKVSEI
jgi:GTP-binding protein